MRPLKLSILFLLFFSILSISAQSVRWGEKEKGDRSHGNLKSVGWAKNNYFTIQGRMNSMGKYKYYLEKLNPQLNLEFSKKLESKTYSYSFANLIDDKLYLFQMKNNGLRMTEAVLSYNAYDINGDLISSKDILTVDGLSRFNQTTDEIKYALSPDKQKIGISFLNFDKKASQSKLINIVVDVNQLEQAKFFIDVLPFDKKVEYIVRDIAISNNGSMVASLGKRIDIDFPYQYELKGMGEKGMFKDPIDLKIEQFYLTNIEFTPYEDHFMFTGHIVVEKDKKNVTTGFFLAKWDENENKIKNLSTFPYTEDFFSSLGYKIEKDGNIDFGGYFDLDIIPQINGGGYLIADHVIGSRLSYHLQSLESIIIPFNSEGELAEKVVLPKKVFANGQHVNGSGYFAFIENEQLHMVYNEHMDNLQKTDYADFEIMDNVDEKKVVTVLASIGKDVKREVLFNYKDQKGYLVPEKCSSDDDKILLGIGDAKKVQYGLLELN